MVWITRKKPGARARTWMCLSCPCLMANRNGCKYGCCLWYEYRLWPCVSGVRLVQNILTGEGRCGFSIYCSRGFKEAVGEAGV